MRSVIWSADNSNILERDPLVYFKFALDLLCYTISLAVCESVLQNARQSSKGDLHHIYITTVIWGMLSQSFSECIN